MSQERDTVFHRKWLGYAEPVEGLVFSLPALIDAQITPDESRELSAAFEAELVPLSSETKVAGGKRIKSLESFFRHFLKYGEPGMLIGRSELPDSLSFSLSAGAETATAHEKRAEVRPTFAIGRRPFGAAQSFAEFDDEAPSPGGEADEPDAKPAPVAAPGQESPYAALLWDLTEFQGVNEPPINLDEPEDKTTGTWRYAPTAKFVRLLSHAKIPVGFLFNGIELRLVYAPAGEAVGHLTFRVAHLSGADGRTLLTALDLLLSATRQYAASAHYTLAGLLAESRKRQADVTGELASQVFEAVEILVSGFEAAARRDVSPDALDWLRPALEEDGDHFYQGVLSIVLRLVFVLYAEDSSLLPMEHALYNEHYSVLGLYTRLLEDSGAHPESMHHRFGAYGRLLALFRAVYFGVKHGTFELPPRHGRLFDPSVYPFLEGDLPGSLPRRDAAHRSAASAPSLDDGTIFQVLERLVRLKGQRLSYRTLDVEQIGSVYESLMGFHVLRVETAMVRLAPLGVWVEPEVLQRQSIAERTHLLKDVCKLTAPHLAAIGKALEAQTRLPPAEGNALVTRALLAATPSQKDAHEKHFAARGCLVLQPGEERRHTGSHYTPRTLTETVVKRTLSPMLAALGEERTASQILELKVCDPAMGSGAFLVAACRELASELVAAWDRAKELQGVVAEHGDAHLYARRLVAQRCLYGVDKNAAAVELAKLSLWLVTMSRTLPFTFVDHALRHGDSLVGLDFEQIEGFSWGSSKQLITCRDLLSDALEQAIGQRQELQDLAPQDDAAAQDQKRRLLTWSQQAIEEVRMVADACVGAFFAQGKDAAREKERKRRSDKVEEWLRAKKSAEEAPMGSLNEEAAAKLEAIEAALKGEVKAWAVEARAKLVPFHWWIEFPEVFYKQRRDPLHAGESKTAAMFEAVVGNPPFGGKNTLAHANAEGFVDWLKVVSPGAHGNSDLSAHFFRRAARILGEHGTFGLIATNTIAQGDTRETGLAALVRGGWVLYDATDSMRWPGAANVTVSVVHGAKGAPAQGELLPCLDGVRVARINSMLKATAERDNPRQLAGNGSSAYVGSYVLGMGFTLTPAEAEALIAQDSRNGECIFPYLGGEEVNTSPTQSFHRYVISFGQMSLEEASRWPALLAIVREKVKPERDKLKDNTDGLHRKKHWWQFGRWTPALYAALAPLQRCLVTSRVTKHLCFSFQPISQIYSEALYVFPVETFTPFAVLQSRIHEGWARMLSSSLDTRLRYAASDCFETFPFPKPEPRAILPELEAMGEQLYEARAAFMADTNQGLTKTYNALKDARITDDARVLELRRLHEDLDRAVLRAYGWEDLAAPPFCPLNEGEQAALKTFEAEVIDRLYALNEVRAKEESRGAMGLMGAKGAKAKTVGAKARAGAAKAAAKEADEDSAVAEPHQQLKLL